MLPAAKLLGIHLDVKLTFKRRINRNTSKANKEIGITLKLNNILPSSALIIIYRSFLEYGDVIHHQSENEPFSNKIETVRYNASLAITGDIFGTPQENLYQVLDLKSLNLVPSASFFYKRKAKKRFGTLQTPD